MKIKSAILAVCCLAAFAAGCAVNRGGSGDNGVQNGEYKTFQKLLFGMNAIPVLYVTCPADRESDVEAMSDEIQALITDIEYSISSTESSSYIYKFNSAAAGEKVEIDYTAYTVLNIAKQAYEFTDGYYNPAVYYSVQAFGFGNTNNYPESVAALPDSATLEAYTDLASHFSELELIAENGAYYAVKPSATVEIGGKTYSLKIDLGGIGKGYAVDLVDAIMDSYGFDYGYFNFASSSITVKKKQGAEDGNYILGFTNPRPTISNTDYARISVSDALMSTSGDYEQYYEIDGVRYCHIIDPATGAPVQSGIMTVTLTGGSAAENDAYTTAIMAMGVEKAVEFINGLSDRQAALTYRSGGSYKIITNYSDITVTDPRFAISNTIVDGKILLDSAS